MRGRGDQVVQGNQEIPSERQLSSLRSCRDNSCVGLTFPSPKHLGLPEGLFWTERRGYRLAQQVRQHSGRRGSVEGAAATPPRANQPSVLCMLSWPSFPTGLRWWVCLIDKEIHPSQVAGLGLWVDPGRKRKNEGKARGLLENMG